MPPPVSGEPPKAEVWEKVHRMDPANLKLLPGQRADDEKSKFFAFRWSVIGPAYAAWKSNEAIPEHGTPLAAWGGVSQGIIELLRKGGFRTVEDIAELNDGSLMNLRVPDAPGIRSLARSFLENKDASASAKREAEKDAEIANMRERMAAMEEMLQRNMIKPDAPLLDDRDTEVMNLRLALDGENIKYDKRWGPDKLREALNAKQAA